MVSTTTPDQIVGWEYSDPASLSQESQTQAASIQAAFSKRQQYNYVWADQFARAAQTGMVQGSRGYQVDTKTEYVYDDAVWRLAIAYAEFTSAQVATASGVTTAMGAISINASASTTTTMATASTNTITLAQRGIYSISVYSVSDAANAGIAYTLVGDEADTANNFASQIGRGPYASDNVSMVSIPFYNCTATNKKLYFFHRQNTGANRNISATIRIGRLA